METLKAVKPTYDIALSYEENYARGPFFDGPFPERVIEKKIRFLDFEVNSIVGIPAGPLLNANWIRVYARLGFDLPVYKTVRTQARPSHPPPNCLFVDVKGQLTEKRFDKTLRSIEGDWKGPLEEISITNSFGMPSRDPRIWQEDVEKAKSYLEPGQILTVSVVGTVGEGDLMQDYARGAALAREAGADIVEINLSCPNVSSGEGQLFTDPEYAGRLCKTVKKALHHTPLMIKIGYLTDDHVLNELAKHTAPSIQAVSGINTLSFEVLTETGDPALPGKGRIRSGICGASIRECGIHQVSRLANIRQKEGYDFGLVGVGGIMRVEDIDRYVEAGADVVMSATGAMWDPYLAYRYWQSRRKPPNPPG
ncbi:MAG TPA: dihydroorotate dehydrogenase [Nitrospiria bacterium]|jgi:dihydroorotate dehydrogenase